MLATFWVVRNRGLDERWEASFVDLSDQKRAEKELDLKQKRLDRIESDIYIEEDKDRSNLAREIKGEVETLRARKNDLNKALDLADSEPLSEQLTSVSESLGDLEHKLDSLASDINICDLEELGLKDGLATLCRRFTDHHGVDVDFHPPKNGDFDAEIPHRSLHFIFHSTHELLANVEQHASTDEATVGLRKATDGCIQIRVHDDGHGFDTADLWPRLAQKNDSALFQMRERLQNSGGEIDVESELRKGTSVYINIPVNHR